MIDIIEYLDDKGIQYWTSGKNVSEGWIGLQCPFCDDRSNHLGVNLTSKIFTCFICGTKGGPEKLVMGLERVGYGKAKDILRNYTEGILTEQEEHTTSLSVKLPTNLTKELQPLHRKYLASRNFEYVYEKYKLQCFTHVGEYNFRIFIPFFYKNRLITFTTRDVSGKQTPKYLSCPNELSVIPIKKTLYNIDSVRDTAVVVEGVTDVWRIGDGAVALMGIIATGRQLSLLSNIKNVYIMLDSSATMQAIGLANSLCTFTNVEILELTEGDPADLPESEIKKLRRKIF